MADDLSGQLASLKIDRSAAAPPPTRAAWPLWLAIAALGGTAAWLGGQALNDGLRKPVVNLGEITTISKQTFQVEPPLART
jgi:hypothetical protein